jgi:hypothetical protein
MREMEEWERKGERESEEKGERRRIGQGRGGGEREERREERGLPIIDDDFISGGDVMRPAKLFLSIFLIFFFQLVFDKIRRMHNILASTFATIDSKPPTRIRTLEDCLRFDDVRNPLPLSFSLLSLSSPHPFLLLFFLFLSSSFLHLLLPSSSPSNCYSE